MNIKNTFLALLASIFLVSCSNQGPKGEQGLQGEAGNGIVSIIKTNNEGLIDTYTITYTDGTTSTFTVTNGQNGNQGIQGEPGKDGHTPVITIGDNGNWFVDGVDSGFKAFNEVKTFVVTFHLNGGVLPKGYSETLIVNQGDTLDLPIPLKDGYVFTGWYTGETVNDKQFSNSDGVFKDLDIFDETADWLNSYFKGNNPDFTPKYKLENLTPFREEVFDIMNKIPYGEVITYNDIAREIADKRGIKKMSAQAVGGAVGWNPICIIIPCHRVVGSNGSLTGYGGGIKNKIGLLKLEGIDLSKFSIPKKGNAL